MKYVNQMAVDDLARDLKLDVNIKRLRIMEKVDWENWSKDD